MHTPNWHLRRNSKRSVRMHCRIWTKRWNWAWGIHCNYWSSARMWRNYRGNGNRHCNSTKRCIFCKKKQKNRKHSSSKAWPISTSKSERWCNSKSIDCLLWRSIGKMGTRERWASWVTVGHVLRLTDIILYYNITTILFRSLFDSLILCFLVYLIQIKHHVVLMLVHVLPFLDLSMSACQLFLQFLCLFLWFGELFMQFLAVFLLETEWS